MYKSFVHYIALTEVAENRFCNIWVICCTTSEIREQMGNQFLVDPNIRCKWIIKSPKTLIIYLKSLLVQTGSVLNFLTLIPISSSGNIVYYNMRINLSSIFLSLKIKGQYLKNCLPLQTLQHFPSSKILSFLGHARVGHTMSTHLPSPLEHVHSLHGSG